MKVKLLKTYNELLPSERAKIDKAYKADVEHGINVHHAQLQKNWLMLMCIVNHDFMGMTAEECLLALANFKEVYRLNSKIKTEAEQMAWLNGKMDEIFGEGNYPYEYIDKLEEL